MVTAVIDCGTNTFNFIVAEWNPGEDSHRLLHAGKYVVKLGEHGFPGGLIHPDAMQRAKQALEAFSTVCKNFGAHKILGCATSAFRTSGNAGQLIDYCTTHCSFTLQVISGEREAELIFKGVKASGVLPEYPVLILDIGGGSNEFIIAEKSRILWKGSYAIGIARLLDRFKPSEPITDHQVSEVMDYLDDVLQEIPALCSHYGLNTLVGASGSFDTLAELIAARHGKSLKTEGLRSYAFNTAEFRREADSLLSSNLEQRLAMPGMLPLRAEMMVLAVITIQWVFKNCGIIQLSMSGYSLKEGLLYETKP